MVVSKEALGPQLDSLQVRFGLRICYKMKKCKSAFGTFGEWSIMMEFIRASTQVEGMLEWVLIGFVGTSKS
jgi:hypothetical protein